MLIAGILVAVVWIALVVVIATALNAMPTGFEATDLRQTLAPRETINS